MKSVYFPILTDSTKTTFFDYVDCLDIPQIDYFAIGIQNALARSSISLMSNADWQRQFVSNQYAVHDPIRRVTLCTERNFIPFDEIDYVNNFGKEIMRQRALFDIKNGIILMKRFSNYSYMITLGTGFSRFDGFEFIQRYHDRVRLIQTDFIKLVERDMQGFLPSKLIHPCGGAR